MKKVLGLLFCVLVVILAACTTLKYGDMYGEYNVQKMESEPEQATPTESSNPFGSSVINTAQKVDSKIGIIITNNTYKAIDLIKKIIC